MVPLPGQLEQRRNAEVMQQAGAARMIAQEELTGERLAKEIGSLMENPDELTRMEAAGRKLARRDAAAASVDLMKRLSAWKPPAASWRDGMRQVRPLI